jgi:Ca-activated chloride channel family protein
MSAEPSDNWIDNELRNVAVPADLLSKLQAISSLDDVEIDRALCDVAVPEGLMARLRAIGTYSDVDLDDELRDVAPPRRLAERLRRVPAAARRKATRLQTIHRLAIAASLFLAVCVGYLAAIAFRSDRPPLNRGTESIAKIPGQNGTRGVGTDVVAAQGRKSPDNDDLSDPKIVERSPRNDVPRDRTDTRSSDAELDNPPQVANTNPLATEDSGAGSKERATSALGAPTPAAEYLPPLRSFAEPSWGGVTPPRAPGYDFSFQLKHGVHPFVSPAANSALATAQVPLVTSTASFNAARQSIQEGSLPPAYKVRPEEFLAAMDYGFARPEGRSVALRTAAGASPWNASSLLQVAAQAGELPRDGKPTHTILMLDASSSMQWELRWENTLAGIAAFARKLRPSDQLSLVVAADKAEIAFENANAQAALAALDRLNHRPAARVTNITDAIQKGADLARAAKSERTQLVLFTDGIASLDDAALESIQRTLDDSANRSPTLSVVDVRQDETIDAQLNRLADVAGKSDRSRSAGAVRHAGSSSAVRWTLQEIVSAHSQVVAAGATMKVTFAPDAVAMYRLIGHEATSVVGLMTATIEADLRSGEAATGLFEVVLKPSGGDTVATVELTWRDPTNGQTQTVRKTVSRFQFAPSFHQAPLSLQLAALAAETAEILRDSYFAPANSHSLAEVARLARDVNPRLQERESFQQLLEIVVRGQRATSSSR